MERAKKLSQEFESLTPTPFDRACWEMIRAGGAPEYIAVLMNSTPEEVEQGRLSVERWKSANSPEIVQARLNEQAIVAMQPVGRTLRAAQSAKRMVRPPVYNDKGEQIAKPVYMPDHATRISATEAVARIVESVKDRGPGMQVNIGNSVNYNGNGKSFEERVRTIREKNGMNHGGPMTIDSSPVYVKDGSEKGDVDEDEDEVRVSANPDLDEIDDSEYADEDDNDDDNDDDIDDAIDPSTPLPSPTH